ncbi:MAG: glycosyltransferase [Patescibacteria group bacterium]|nr:glycosyltransferase [Patescibacteria group bacterium]MCL5095174.1 glycosyltransferase [Patescibacteria group bacterium]
MKNINHRFLSVVIPTYHQEKIIVKDVKKINAVLKKIRYDYEIIVVVDGKDDKTFSRAKKIEDKKIKVVGYETNHGKGYAVRFGMARTKGDIVAFIDAGMDLDPNGLSMLLEHFEWYNADIIVGSKRHPASQIDYPWQRKIISRVYQMMVRILFGLNVRDTQAGIKFFKREVLENVLPRLIVKTYAFDIEILAVAHRLGYKRIFEAPIRLVWNLEGSIVSQSILRAIFSTLWDTAAVFYRLKILHYYDNSNKRKWRYDKDLDYRVNIG